MRRCARPEGVLLAASVDGVLRATSVDGCCARRVWRGAARGECGENVESFFSRGRSA
jgi:hypothetical protein